MRFRRPHEPVAEIGAPAADGGHLRILVEPVVDLAVAGLDLLADLAGVNVASAEALVLAPGDTNGVAVRVLSRWDPTG